MSVPAQPAVTWTGYGAPAHTELRRLVAELKQGDLLQPVTLIVPNNLAGVAARRTLARGLSPDGPPGVAALTVLTVDRLAELLASPSLTAAGKIPLTAVVLAAVWRRELSLDPGVFREVAEHPATVTALVRAHRQLRELTDEARAAVATTGPLPAAMVALHERVVANTHDRWYDVVDLRTTAAAALPGAALDLGFVIVHLPQDLEASQLAVLRALADRVPVHVIGAMTGNHRADSGVEGTFRRWGLDLPNDRFTLAIAQEVHHASDSDDEIRSVVRRVMSSLETTPGHRIAVLYGNRVPYARLLHEHLTKAGVTFNGPGVRPTAERQVPRALLQLLALAETDLDRAGLFHLLAGMTVLDADRPVPSARWERLSRSAGVVGADDWEVRLTAYAEVERGRAAAEADSDDPRQSLIDRRTREAQAADALRSFVVRLRADLARGRSAQTWTELSRWALDLVASYLGAAERRTRSAPEEQRAGVTVTSVLTSLAALDAVADAADLGTLRNIVELELEDDLPRVGTFGTGVFVGPLSSALGLELDEVHLVGLAEGLTPGRLHEDALLPEAARLASAGQLPALRARLDREHRHLMAALAVSPKAVANFPRGDLRRGGERLPSRWLMPTLRELAGDKSLQATEWKKAIGPWLVGSPSFAASVMSTAQPADEQEWRLRALTSRAADLPDDPVLASALALAHARHSSDFTRYDGNLTAHSGSLPNPADGQRVSSPTSLESWVSCPHAYFLKRILYVEPVELPEELVSISPADRGSLMHDTLDQFFRAGHQPEADASWSLASRRVLRSLAEQIGEQFRSKGLTGHPTMWARERLLVFDDLDQLLSEDERMRAAEGRTQVRSELRFGRGAGNEPIPVTLAGGRVVLMAGSADRVDTRADGSLVVTDYKSGSATTFKGLSQDDPDKNGSKLQLPVYGLAARRELGDQPVRAEYWFIGAKNRGDRIGFELTDEVLTRYTSVLATVVDGIAQGVFPANAPEDRAWSPFVACAYCDPDGLGAKERRIQWDRKKHAAPIAPYLALTEGQTP